VLAWSGFRGLTLRPDRSRTCCVTLQSFNLPLGVHGFLAVPGVRAVLTPPTSSCCFISLRPISFSHCGSTMGFPRCDNGARSGLNKQNLSRVFDRALQAVTSCVGSMGINRRSLIIGQRPKGEWREWRRQCAVPRVSDVGCPNRPPCAGCA